MFAESRTVWFDWKVRLFKGPTQFPLYMDIAIYLTSVEWFDQHFPCSSMNQLFVDFSNYIDIAIKFSQLPYNRINNQNRRDEERNQNWLCHLHHLTFVKNACFEMFAIEVWNCLSMQWLFFFGGGGGGGIQDSHWKIQTHKIYIKLPKIGLGNHQPSPPFANKFIPRITFRIRARSLYPIFTTITVWSHVIVPNSYVYT